MSFHDGSRRTDDRPRASAHRAPRPRARDRRGRAHQRPDRPVPRGRQTRDPPARRVPRAVRARRRAGSGLGRDRGRRDDDGRGPDRLRRARRRRRRQGVLRAQGGQGPRPCRAGSKAPRSMPTSAACWSRTWSPRAGRRSARSRRCATRVTSVCGVLAICDRLAGGAEAIEQAAGAPFVALTTIDEVYPDRPDRLSCGCSSDPRLRAVRSVDAGPSVSDASAAPRTPQPPPEPIGARAAHAQARRRHHRG